MPLNGSTSPENRLAGLLHAFKQRAVGLRRNLTTVFAAAIILLFFLYIPFIHGPLNAGVVHTDSNGAYTATVKPGTGNREHTAAAKPYVAAAAPPAPVTVTGNNGPSRKAAPTLNAQSHKLLQDMENSPPAYQVPGAVKNPRGDSAWARASLPLYSPADITRGDRTSRMLAITFDGGYSANSAAVVLDELKERGITTTFFLSGTFMQLHPDVTRRIVEDGHEVGNHTATHPHLTDYSSTYRHNTLDTVNRTTLIKELRNAEKTFKIITGTDMAPLWRAPYGEVNKELRAWAFEFGYLHIGWTYERETRESLDTLDWVSEPSSRFYLTKEEMLERITGFGKKGAGAGGGIILMHLGTQRTDDRASAVLGSMLDRLMARGYRFVTVSTMLGDNRELKTAYRTKSIRSYKKLSSIR